MAKPPPADVLQSTLQRIADRVVDGTTADIGLVSLRLESGVYRIKAFAGDFPAECIPELDFRAGEAGVGAQTAASAEPALIGDYPAERPHSPHRTTSQRVGARSIVTAAVGPVGDVAAVLYLISRSPHRLTVADRDRVVAQAGMAEIAIRLALELQNPEHDA